MKQERRKEPRQLVESRKVAARGQRAICSATILCMGIWLKIAQMLDFPELAGCRALNLEQSSGPTTWVDLGKHTNMNTSTNKNAYE